MFIFDSFDNQQRATDFAIHVRDRFHLSTRVFDSQDESDKYDPFPFQLTAPIVLVILPDDPSVSGSIQNQLAAVVDCFGGDYVGT